MGGISAEAAKARIHARGEIAFLDVREQGQYGEGHPFLAVPCAFSQLDFRVADLVPRKSVPVIIIDDGDGVAERAARRLEAVGYTDVSWIIGGAPAWQAAGFTLFKGVNLPSKTLGELIHEEWHVPHIDAGTLAAWQSQNRSFRLFDTRPASEYRKSTIPGAHSLPNGELPHRFPVAVDDPDMPVVVHCAGRTRSIVGAAGLALAGVRNPIFALEDGTQGWVLSGHELSWRNAPDALPSLDSAALESSAGHARELMERYDIRIIDHDGLQELAKEENRTFYLLDVRSAEEFAVGSYAGARHAPGVQLVQATDLYIGVRRARVVLTCDTGLRSAIAAVFLQTLNYEVYVLPGADARTPASETPAKNNFDLPEITASEALCAGGNIIDVSNSMEFRAGHLEGAQWGIRPRLHELRLAKETPVLLAGPRHMAELVAADLCADGFADIRYICGNPESWRAEGLAIAATPNDPPDESAIDFLFFVHDRHDGNKEAAKRYLAWEKGLVAQLDSAERGEFRIAANPFG